MSDIAKIPLVSSYIFRGNALASKHIKFFALRSDIQAKYVRFMAKIMKYTKDGADIIIKNRRLHQATQAIKHGNLVNV